MLVTILHRPYVFGFFIAFLTIGTLNRGLPRTLLFLILGFAVAFLSEISSIRNGFPYGVYHYLYENLQGEIVWWGVPAWDSLSYTFMAYASYETAAQVFPSFVRRGPGGGTILAALLMMLLDVIVDPLAVRGDRWFLGKIFYYPNGGIYFGVPLSNFAGWFLVAVVIFALYQTAERGLRPSPPPLHAPALGPLLYMGIALFNLIITFWIGEWQLGEMGIFFLTSTFALFALRRRSLKS